MKNKALPENYDELQSYFIKRIERFVRSREPHIARLGRDSRRGAAGERRGDVIAQ